MSAPRELSDVNARINRAIRYTPDEGDHWQTPVETLSLGQGDCEDYAIAKLAALLAAGWRADDVRLVYCQRDGGAHMVVEVHHAGAVWVLDNLGNLVSGWAQREDLQPLFSFTADRFWVRNQLTEVDPKQRLGQWRRLLERAKRQGTNFGVTQ